MNARLPRRLLPEIRRKVPTGGQRVGRVAGSWRGHGNFSSRMGGTEGTATAAFSVVTARRAELGMDARSTDGALTD